MECVWRRGESPQLWAQEVVVGPERAGWGLSGIAMYAVVPAGSGEIFALRPAGAGQ